MELYPVNAEAVALWRLLDRHARDLVGMEATPGPLRLEAVRGECDRYADPEGMFAKVMLVESLIWPARMKEQARAR